MNQWTDYLNMTFKQLHSKAEQAGIIGHPSSIGDNREKIISCFLSNHLPSRLILSNNAKIFSVDGVESKEIDIVIISDISLNFLNEMRMYTNIESLASAITVKSHLNKDELFNALENLASIPQINNDVLDFRLLKNSAFNEFVSTHPTMFVFAYSALQAKTILKHINDFYSKHPQIQKNRYPRAIIVNGQYMITYHRENKVTTTGYEIPADSFYINELDNGMEGFPLSLLLNEISAYTDWLPFITLSPHVYFNSGFFD